MLRHCFEARGIVAHPGRADRGGGDHKGKQCDMAAGCRQDKCDIAAPAGLSALRRVLEGARDLGHPCAIMQASPFKSQTACAAITPSPRTRHAELLRLCARIGYSPPGHA